MSTRPRPGEKASGVGLPWSTFVRWVRRLWLDGPIGCWLSFRSGLCFSEVYLVPLVKVTIILVPDTLKNHSKSQKNYKIKNPILLDST